MIFLHPFFICKDYMPKKSISQFARNRTDERSFLRGFDDKKACDCRGGTLHSFRWHFGVVPKALYNRPNITFSP